MYEGRDVENAVPVIDVTIYTSIGRSVFVLVCQ